MTTTDRIRAHAMGVDLGESQRIHSLIVELQGAYDYIARLEAKAAEYRRQRDAWHRDWMVAMGLLMLCTVVIIAVAVVKS